MPPIRHCWVAEIQSNVRVINLFNGSLRPRYFISMVIDQKDLEESRDGKLKIKINKNGSIKSFKNMHNY